MMDYIDAPVIYAPPSYGNIAPYQPKRTIDEMALNRTSFESLRSGVSDFLKAMTGSSAAQTKQTLPASSLSAHTATGEESVESLPATIPSAEKVNQISKIANQRVQLLAARYATTEASAEVVARLEILNRRLVEHAPLVSTEQITALESAHDHIKQFRAAREARSQRYGITV